MNKKFTLLAAALMTVGTFTAASAAVMIGLSVIIIT